VSGVNATELKIIDWLKGERERGSDLWAFLRGIAEGDEFEYGDHELGNCLADLLDSDHNMHADVVLADTGADLRAARELRRELAESQDDPAGWLEELDAMAVRVFLMQVNPNDDLYVHSLVKGYHPNNRYRVADAYGVYEPGFTSATGYWGLSARDRQICDEPIGKPCSCRIEQRERGA
jgi:hypothetical protein